MSLALKIIHLFCLFIIFSRNVDAFIEIFDPYGRRVERFKDREEPFFDDIPEEEGFIVLTDPPDACYPVEEPPFSANSSYCKFALINGTGTCGYRRKIQFAGDAGFDFAVIFDPLTGPAGVFNFGPDHIPVVLISYEAGSKIKDNYLYNVSSIYNYRISIKPNNQDFTLFMYLFGAVIGVCFFVMFLFMMCLLIKCIQERRRSRRNRLSSRQIKQLPSAKFQKGDQYDVCAICLEDYNEGDKLRILPCSHAYHEKCIDPWLMNNRRNCPLCKRKITFGDSADENSDSEDSELTSPAENTPLLTSPSNRGQTWGTFVNSVQTVNDNDTGGPSSLPDSYPSLNNNSRHNAADNWQASDTESECLLPPPHLSVNSGIPERNPLEVQVNFVNPFDHETSSSHAASI